MAGTARISTERSPARLFLFCSRWPCEISKAYGDQGSQKVPVSCGWLLILSSLRLPTEALGSARRGPPIFPDIFFLIFFPFRMVKALRPT